MIGRRKDEARPGPQVPQPRQTATSHAHVDPRTEHGPGPRGLMNIGKSVHIKGELTANEEVTIDGTIDGSIVVENHQLTIGVNGRITADVRAKAIVVLGKVVGNITAGDRVEVRPGGSVEGDIRSPRVALADGSVFKGSIDMQVAETPPRARVQARASEQQHDAPVAEIVDAGSEDQVHFSEETRAKLARMSLELFGPKES